MKIDIKLIDDLREFFTKNKEGKGSGYADRIINEYASRSKWVSVEEGLPELSCYCLVVYAEFGLNGNYHSVVTFNHLINSFSYSDKDYKNFTITHWQPLPPKP